MSISFIFIERSFEKNITLHTDIRFLVEWNDYSKLFSYNLQNATQIIHSSELFSG